MKKKIVFMLAILVAVILIALRVGIKRSSRETGLLHISGNIEVTEIQVSFKIPGRVAARLVSEGDVVTNGQVVARLETGELEQELALRQAEIDGARANLADLEAGARTEEIEQADAARAVAMAEAGRLSNDYRREQELFALNVIPRREYEAAETAWNVATSKVREAEARLTLLKNGARPETIKGARARLEQTRQMAQLAATRLGYATIAAPGDGLVLAEGVESGEYVVPGTPVINMGDVRQVWMRAFINETDLGRIKVGQAVRVSTDTRPEKTYSGRIVFIAPQAEFTPKNVQTAKERVKLVYRIKIAIPNPELELKPGMPADGVIALQ